MSLIAQGLDTHLIITYSYTRKTRKVWLWYYIANHYRMRSHSKNDNIRENIIQCFYEHITNIVGGKTTNGKGTEQAIRVSRILQIIADKSKLT